MIILSKEIRKGERVVIDKANDGYYIRFQEHESICGGHLTDADKEGWRDCLISFEYTEAKAVEEMERIALRYQTI